MRSAVVITRRPVTASERGTQNWNHQFNESLYFSATRCVQFHGRKKKKKKAILGLCASIHYHIPDLRTPAQLKQHGLSVVLFVLLAALLRDPVSGVVSLCALHMAVKFHAEGRSRARQMCTRRYLLSLLRVNCFLSNYFHSKRSRFAPRLSVNGVSTLFWKSTF